MNNELYCTSSSDSSCIGFETVVDGLPMTLDTSGVLNFSAAAICACWLRSSIYTSTRRTSIFGFTGATIYQRGIGGQSIKGVDKIQAFFHPLPMSIFAKSPPLCGRAHFIWSHFNSVPASDTSIYSQYSQYWSVSVHNTGVTGAFPSHVTKQQTATKVSIMVQFVDVPTIG